jgi:membrane-bound ClpP family serine protease
MQSALRTYLLVNVPGWLLAAVIGVVAVRWFGLSPGLAAAGVAAWVVKDLVLYPWMRGSYSAGPTEPPIVGKEGVVLTALAPKGLVRVQGEIWEARATDVIAAGARVRVRDVHGLQLVVDATGSGDSR